MPTPCMGGHCDMVLSEPLQSFASSAACQPSSRMASPDHSDSCNCMDASLLGASASSDDNTVITCMLCDTSGHAHGTVRLIFEPQSQLHYCKGQTLRVLLPGHSGPKILITSTPRNGMVMHGRLLIAKDQRLPAQFGPDATFGLMFQVTGPAKACTSKRCTRPYTDPFH